MNTVAHSVHPFEDRAIKFTNRSKVIGIEDSPLRFHALGHEQTE